MAKGDEFWDQNGGLSTRVLFLTNTVFSVEEEKNQPNGEFSTGKYECSKTNLIFIQIIKFSIKRFELLTQKACLLNKNGWIYNNKIEFSIKL